MIEKDKLQDHDKWLAFVIALVSAFIGSGSGVALVFNTPLGENMARPDPFTGSQAAALTLQIEHLQKELDEHTDNHPDEANQFDRRIATLEAQYAIILQNQGRILDRLNHVD